MNDKVRLLELVDETPEWSPDTGGLPSAAEADTASGMLHPEKRKPGRPRKKTADDDDGSGSPEVVREGRGGKRLLSILGGMASEISLYWDNLGESYISFADGRLERLGKNNSLEQRLSLLYYKTTGETLGRDSFTAAVIVLAAQAKETGMEIELFTRSGEFDGRIYYDLKNCRALSMGADGWEVDPHPPVFFRTFSTQQPHPDPVKGGDPWLFFNHTNVAQENRLLLMVWIITAFVPRIPYPALLVSGSEGSGKSTFSKFLKRIIDPSAVGLQDMPRKDDDFDLLLYKHYCLALDNLSSLPVSRADRLCSAITSAYIEKRMLHTDVDTIILPCSPRLILNGINALTNRPDLLDRSITIRLDRIDPTKSRAIVEVDGAFDRDLPEILGGIADTLSRAMTIFPEVTLASYPRMADFCRWGYAVAEALGGRGGEFLKTYAGNSVKLSDSLLENNTFMSALVQLMSDTRLIKGTFKGIIDRLYAIATPDRNDFSFPTARTFRAHLERLRPSLEKVGVFFEFGRHTSKGYTVELFKKEPPPTWAMLATGDGSDQAAGGVPDDLIFDASELPE